MVYPARCLLTAGEKVFDFSNKNQTSKVDHETFWSVLFSNFNYSFEAVDTVIDSLLTVKDRCRLSPFYIQAIQIREIVFLTSNVARFPEFMVTKADRRWLVGRNKYCAISLQNGSISDCHALIGYIQNRGFYLSDAGSAAGTKLNRQILPPSQQWSLQDGDLMELGQVSIEFFTDTFDAISQVI